MEAEKAEQSKVYKDGAVGAKGPGREKTGLTFPEIRPVKVLEDFGGSFAVRDSCGRAAISARYLQKRGMAMELDNKIIAPIRFSVYDADSHLFRSMGPYYPATLCHGGH